MRARALPIRIKPEEWLSDTAGCSLAAQGLYLRLMFVAHDAEPYGRLATNGQPIPPDGLARRCGCSLEEFERLHAELEAASAMCRAEDGTLYCRRMVRDGEKRAAATRRQKKHRSRNAAVTRLSQPTANLLEGKPPAERSDPAEEQAHKSESEPTNGAGAPMPRSISLPDILGLPRPYFRGIRSDVSPLGSRPDLFEKFWRLYPRKQLCGAARRAFETLSAQEIPIVMSAVKHLTWASGYIPLAASWLLGRRWDQRIPSGGEETTDSEENGGATA